MRRSWQNIKDATDGAIVQSEGLVRTTWIRGHAVGYGGHSSVHSGGGLSMRDWRASWACPQEVVLNRWRSRHLLQSIVGVGIDHPYTKPL